MKEKTILVVEDDVGTRALLKKLLEVGGCEPIEARDGLAALEILSDWRSEEPYRPWPHLILLDLGLPGMSGLQVLRRIRENEEMRFVPVVIFSSGDDPLVVKSAYEFGANGYVRKPAGVDSFRLAIEALCRFWCEWNETARPSAGHQQRRHVVEPAHRPPPLTECGKGMSDDHH